MSKYLIGDIHGCAQEFEQLLHELAFNPSKDELFLAGDLVGRGPDAKGVLDLAIKHDAQMVLGNFDLHYIACAEGYRIPRKDDNFHTLLDLPTKEVKYYNDWFVDHPFFLEGEGFLLAHASLNPLWTLEECRAYSAKIDRSFHRLRKYFKGDLYIDVLRNKDFITDPEMRHSLEILLTFMICRFFKYRQPHEESIILGRRTMEELMAEVVANPQAFALEDASPANLESYSTIFKDPSVGFLDLDLGKGLPICDFEEGLIPWFNVQELLDARPDLKGNPNLEVADKGKPIYFGHWSYLRNQQLPDGYICTDTSCVYGFELSAYLLPEKSLPKEDYRVLAQPIMQVHKS